MDKELLRDGLTKRQITFLIIIIMIISSFFGFIYEEIFYYFDLGYLVKRGSTFGPWIPIYAFGGLFIFVLTYRFKNKPFIVFGLSLLITGLLEYLTGMFFYEVFNTRLWDYNTEILNYGNINGYICLRSVLLFGLSGLFLIYIISPLLIKIIKKANEKVICLVSYTLLFLFIIDMICYFIINHI